MIPFIRYLPNGTSRGESVRRSSEIEAMAARFIAAGGRYRVCDELDNSLRLSATMMIDGAHEDVEIEVAPNGLMLLGAVDRLVRLSDLHVTTITVEDSTDIR